MASEGMDHPDDLADPPRKVTLWTDDAVDAFVKFATDQGGRFMSDLIAADPYLDFTRLRMAWEASLQLAAEDYLYALDWLGYDATAG